MKNTKIMNPMFYERTKEGEVFYDISSRLIKDRVIFLSEDITQQTASVITPLLFMLDHESNEKISLWINSTGGEIYAFLSMYDMMQLIKSPIETICVGTAMSAAALLLAAGEKGKRTATPNAKIMIHQAIGGTGYQKVSDMLISSKHVSDLNDDVHKILAKHTGQPLEKVIADCKEDRYLSAQEALEYGIIDRIVPFKKDVPQLVKPVKSKTSIKKVSVNRKK